MLSKFLQDSAQASPSRGLMGLLTLLNDPPVWSELSKDWELLKARTVPYSPLITLPALRRGLSGAKPICLGAWLLTARGEESLAMKNSMGRCLLWVSVAQNPRVGGDQVCDLRQLPAPFLHVIPGPGPSSFPLPVACQAVWDHYILSCLGERMFVIKLAVKPFCSIPIFKYLCHWWQNKCYFP